MKIALAQINPTIGDFAGNEQKIISAAGKARAGGADLAVFSEMVVMGYPARDLLEKPAFLAAQDAAISRLAHELNGLPTLLGVVLPNPTGNGRPLHNSWIFLDGGRVVAEGHKCLLPTYDVFDEDRYFQPAETPRCIDFRGCRIGVTICEDAWNDKDFWTAPKYAFDPVAYLAGDGAQLIVNLSASPYHAGKPAMKETMLSRLAAKHGLPLLYANQIGGNDDLVFDGRSLAFDEKGALIARGPAFTDDVLIVDMETKTGPIAASEPEIEDLHKALVLGLRDYAHKCGFKSAVLGLSGGIDSAVVGALAAEALGAENVTGVALPTRFNAPESLGDAKELAERLGVQFHVVAIEELFGVFRTALAPVFAGRAEDVAEENMQARIRGVILMGLSNKFGHLLLTTGNKSELATGYCTLYGDMCGGLAVISDLYKTTVYELAEHLNKINPANPPIPVSSITKAPTAELRYNQKDQDSLPPYDILDAVLKLTVEEHMPAAEIIAKGYDAAMVRKVFRMLDINEYKRRQAAPGLKLTGKAFGTGRRMPIAQRFRDGRV